MRVAITLAAVAAVLGSPGAAPGDGKEPSAKAREAVRALKADLDSVEILVYLRLGKGQPEADSDAIRLVTDPKKVPAKGKGVYPITEKQASAYIDALAAASLFDEVDVDPPGIAGPSWCVAVSAGRPARRIGFWRYHMDFRPLDMRVTSFLAEALDGDAKSAVQGFRNPAGGPKR